MEGVIYKLSSTQIYLPEELSQEIIEWGTAHVSDRDLFTDPTDPSIGRENEIHVTVLYGIHSDDPSRVRALLSDVKSFVCSLESMSTFTTNSRFDVLKIDVLSSQLHALHNKLRSLDHTNGYPIYRPHVTIAYVLKGRSYRFTNNKAFKGKIFTVKEIIFSSRDGNKITIPIG